MVKVGIIANPISARDIRRVISHAGNLPINDRANIVLRMMAGLAACGVGEVVVMPEHGGIRFQLERSIQRGLRMGHTSFPHLRYLDMPVTATPADSARAARMMADEGVAAIVVLGGDGTNRVVVGACGAVPVAGVSTGTNNAFPELRESTTVGLAVGLYATGQLDAGTALVANKLLEVRIDGAEGVREDIALVDAAIADARLVGARALWKPEGLHGDYLSFAEAEAIGLSSIGGLIEPVARDEARGLALRLARHPAQCRFTIRAPIAPGLIRDVAIADVESMPPGQPFDTDLTAGIVALDGERELAFRQGDRVRITLRADAFATIAVARCLAQAARRGLLRSEDRPA